MNTTYQIVTIYMAVRDKPGTIYQVSNAKPTMYFGNDPRQLLGEVLLAAIVGAHGVDIAHRPALLARAIVGPQHQQRVVQLASAFEEINEPANLVIGVVGAFIGGFLGNLVGLAATGIIGSLILSTIGAVVLIWLIGKFGPQ